MCDLESVFGVVGLIFKPREAYLPQGPLSLCFGQLKHPGRRYLANRASEWHLNAKFGENALKSNFKRSQKSYFNDEKVTRHVVRVISDPLPHNSKSNFGLKNEVTIYLKERVT